MRPGVHRRLECFELRQEIRKVLEGSTGDEVGLEVIEGLLHFPFTPRMARQGTRRLKAVVSTEVEVVRVPLEIGVRGIEHKHTGVVHLHTTRNPAGLDQAVLEGFKNSTLIFRECSIVDPEAAERVDVGIDEDLGDHSGDEHGVGTPVKL